MTSKARKITARYTGRCFCGDIIAQGEDIAWERGAKAAHWDCHTKALANVADAHGTPREAARGVGELIPEGDYGHIDHPENAEQVLAMTECEEFAALDKWAAMCE